MRVSDGQRRQIATYVRAYLLRTATSFGHQNAVYRATARWTHTLNVVQNLKQILAGEGASPESGDICEVGALFHDIDHYTVQAEYHAMRGAETATHFLAKEGYDPDFIRRVDEVIRHHHQDLDDEIPVDIQLQHIIETLSPEARMVFDADTLDKVGVSNILQSVLSMGMAQKAEVAEAATQLTSGWPLQRAKLWKELLTTRTGKMLGEERFAFYEQFLKQVALEIAMQDPFPLSTETQELAQI